MDQRKFEIAAAISFEVGKNRTEALAEVWEAVDAIRVFARSMEENGRLRPEDGPGRTRERTARLVMKPYGVWPVISPFNFPFMLANGMASGALITGNTVVLKPTSAAPLTGLMLYRAYRGRGGARRRSELRDRPRIELTRTSSPGTGTSPGSRSPGRWTWA